MMIILQKELAEILLLVGKYDLFVNRAMAAGDVSHRRYGRVIDT